MESASYRARRNWRADLHVNQKYGIRKEAALAAAKVFIESASFAGLLDNKGYLRVKGASNEVESAETFATAPKAAEVTTNTEQPLGKPITSTDVSRVQVTKPAPDGLESVLVPEGLDRIEIRLLNGKKVFWFLPQPLPYGEKERLKKWLDLVLEEEPVSQ